MDRRHDMIEQTISRRTGYGPNETVMGWQTMLAQLLSQMAEYLRPGHVVTFRRLTDAESRLFERVALDISPPPHVCGLYLPPSVRNQMLYTNRGLEIPKTALTPPDAGVLLFSRPTTQSTIVNVLLAYPPHTPAIDVYERGAMLAGYVFDDIDACLRAIADVLATHFSARSEGGKTGSGTAPQA